MTASSSRAGLLLLSAVLLGGCADGGVQAEAPAPDGPFADVPFLALQDCRVMLGVAPFPREAVAAVLPPGFAPVTSVPGHADVQLALWHCQAIAVDGDTVVPDAVLGLLTVPVNPENATWTRPGHFSEFLLEAWVDETALLPGVVASGLPTHVAHRAAVEGTRALVEDAQARHALSAPTGSLGDSPAAMDLGIRYFGAHRDGTLYAWDLHGQIEAAELLPRPGFWAFQAGALEQVAGASSGTHAAHLQTFTGSYAFEAVRFEAAG